MCTAIVHPIYQLGISVFPAAWKEVITIVSVFFPLPIKNLKPRGGQVPVQVGSSEQTTRHPHLGSEIATLSQSRLGLCTVLLVSFMESFQNTYVFSGIGTQMHSTAFIGWPLSQYHNFECLEDLDFSFGQLASPKLSFCPACSGLCVYLPTHCLFLWIFVPTWQRLTSFT